MSTSFADGKRCGISRSGPFPDAIRGAATTDRRFRMKRLFGFLGLLVVGSAILIGLSVNTATAQAATTFEASPAKVDAGSPKEAPKNLAAMAPNLASVMKKVKISLGNACSKAERTVKGKAIAARLVAKSDRPLYEIAVMIVKGQKISFCNVSLDAVTGKIVKKVDIEEEEHGGREVKVPIDKVPAAVKAAILKEVGEGRLVDIGEITRKNGTKVYEIEMWKGGSEYDVLFDSKGKVLAREKESGEDDQGEKGDDDDGDKTEEEHGGREVKVSIDKVPAAVKAAILKEVGQGRLVDIGEITRKSGAKVYEIEMWKGGSEFDVLFDANGKVLKREKENGEDE